MSDTVKTGIKRAKYLLQNVTNAAIATVNEDGTPHNTPVLCLHDATLEHLYWSSHPESLHSQNIARTGQVFIVFYEGNAGGGLYVQADEAHVLSGSELTTAVDLYNAVRQHAGKDPLPWSCYRGDNPQRMYAATTRAFFVNVSERTENGDFLKDTRVEVSRGDLIS